MRNAASDRVRTPQWGPHAYSQISKSRFPFPERSQRALLAVMDASARARAAPAAAPRPIPVAGGVGALGLSRAGAPTGRTGGASSYGGRGGGALAHSADREAPPRAPVIGSCPDPGLALPELELPAPSPDALSYVVRACVRA